MAKVKHVCCVGHFFNDRDADEKCPCTGRCGFHVKQGKKKGIRK